MGLIALAGLAAETRVIMLLYLDVAYKEAVEKGLMRRRKDLVDAIFHGAVTTRLRPKIMTASVIMGGLIPIMWSHGTGADVMKRIATPMVGEISARWFWCSAYIQQFTTSGKDGDLKMNSWIPALLLLVFFNTWAEAQPYKGSPRPHPWGKCTGEVIVSESGVEYRTEKKKHSHQWKWVDIQSFDRKSPTAFSILTYQDQKWALGADRH